MKAEEIQGVSTLSSGVKCVFHVQKTVVQALFYNGQLN